MTNIAVAHRLAAVGIPVFPAHQETKVPLVRFTCAATKQARGVDYHWSLYPDALPGIHLFGVGLVAIDLDIGHGNGTNGIAEFDRLLDQYGELPPCSAVRTPRGGVHLYFKQPAGRESIGNSTSRIAAGVDVRGINGYTVASGAVMATGEFYENITGTPDLADAFKAGEIPEVPGWLVDLAERPAPVPERGPSYQLAVADSRLRAFGLAVLEGEAAELAAAPVGCRNASLNKAAFVVASKGAAHGAITEQEAWDALWSASVSNGYVVSTAAGDGAKAFERTFRSGWRDGLAKPSAGPRERLETIDPNFTAGLKPRAA